ncbi:Sir2 family protein [Whalleya microplaca]|nr:Sir2 family protein [Whalleya microplaca]
MPLEPGSTSLPAFHTTLLKSRRILALCGAGLSVPSGLPTFRGQGLWRNKQAQLLATPKTFETDPDLVWMFYAARRHAALQVAPNAGHVALAELAREMGEGGFLCLTQNVDGLSPRAGHPHPQLRTLHGSLFDLRCSASSCAYVEHNNTADPLCASLAPWSENVPADLERLPLLDPTAPLPPRIPASELPHCPRCGALLRPSVVQFGEELDAGMLEEIRAWIDDDAPEEKEKVEEEEGKEEGQGKEEKEKRGVDLVLAIGTTAEVWPAAGFIVQARKRGAALAVVNASPDRLGAARDLRFGDFVFIGDAAELLPKMMEPLQEKAGGS